MITNKVLAETIRKASKVSGSEMMLKDNSGKIIANTFSKEAKPSNNTKVYSIEKDGTVQFSLYVEGGVDSTLSGEMTALQIESLIDAYEEKIDKKSYYSKLISENPDDGFIYSYAKKLHIKSDVSRCVFIIEPVGNKDNNALEIVNELYSGQTEEVVFGISGGKIVLVKASEDAEEAEETARMLADMISAEAMQSVKIAYGNIVRDLNRINRSYKEARMALEIGQIFYIEKSIIAYATLGVGRLIYQLPIELCRLYVEEIFGENVPEEFDDEMLSTINRFFDNNLNISETSRQLSMHRNTLLYRIEKVQKATGLDVRNFDDALALKIALMVVNYMKFIENKEI